MGSKYFQQLGRACNDIADELAGSDGFIATRDLLKRFGIAVVSRPLLVEAMLATRENRETTGSRIKHEWCLLLDSETHTLRDGDLQRENPNMPLSPRLRNTIAHEIAHSLAFRTRDFGVEIPRLLNKNDERDFVSKLERETEALSPLLLVSNKSLDSLFNRTADYISLSEVLSTMRNAGASREAFISRLQLLELFDRTRIVGRDCFLNLAIGLGEWVSQSEAVLRPWPLFARFEGGAVPQFIFDLQRRIPVNPARVFRNPFSFEVGGQYIVSQIVPGGTPKLPSLKQLDVRFSAEAVHRIKGAEFLFLIQICS